MLGKVAMFVLNDTSADSRVHRQASCLAEAGYQVRVYGFLTSASQQRQVHKCQNSSYEVILLDQRSPLDLLWDRYRPRRKPKAGPAPEQVAQLCWPSPREPQRPCPPPPPRNLPLHSQQHRRKHRAYVLRINDCWYRHALRWKPDFCQAHDLDSLWAAQATSLALGTPLVYDSHEIWSEQHFLEDWEEVTWWNQWEARLAPNIDGWITVNQSLADLIGHRYQVEVLPLYNCPRLQALPQKGLLKERFQGRPVALFSGGFLGSRGLEQMLAAALLQKEVAIVLQGFGPMEAALRKMAAEHRSPVEFLPRVKPAQVVEICSQADIGVMPVLPDCLNSYYCTPNKIFDYMMAGLAIAAADIPEMSLLLGQCQNGLLYDAFSPNDLAQTLTTLAQDDIREKYASASRHWADSRYNWEQESLKLIRLYQELSCRPLKAKMWVDPQIPVRAEKGAARSTD